MPTYANITPLSSSDGVPYATSVPLTSTEADLYNQAGATDPNLDPIVMPYGQAILAWITLAVTGAPVGNSTYVVMQTDLGSGFWVDVAWIMYIGTQGSANFVMSAGGVGSINNAFQQIRNANSPPTPQANGSNAMILGSRIRFVGGTQLSGGSSSVPGSFIGVLATIRYRVLGLN